MFPPLPPPPSSPTDRLPSVMRTAVVFAPTPTPPPRLFHNLVPVSYSLFFVLIYYLNAKRKWYRSAFILLAYMLKCWNNGIIKVLSWADKPPPPQKKRSSPPSRGAAGVMNSADKQKKKSSAEFLLGVLQHPQHPGSQRPASAVSIYFSFLYNKVINVHYFIHEQLFWLQIMYVIMSQLFDLVNYVVTIITFSLYFSIDGEPLAHAECLDGYLDSIPSWYPVYHECGFYNNAVEFLRDIYKVCLITWTWSMHTSYINVHPRQLMFVL